MDAPTAQLTIQASPSTVLTVNAYNAKQCVRGRLRQFPMLNYRMLFALAIALFGVLAAGTEAQASFVFNIQQVGQNIVIAGNGSINTNALSEVTRVSRAANFDPSDANFDIGPVVLTPAVQFFGLIGPGSLGIGGVAYPNSGSGDRVGVEIGDEVAVPAGYTSGAPLADTATYDSETFATLGLTQGTYLYTWGTGATADSLTVNIGTVPEPASLALVGVPAAVALLRRRRVGR